MKLTRADALKMLDDSKGKMFSRTKLSKEIISQLEGSSLNSETIKTIIRQMCHYWLRLYRCQNAKEL